MQAARVVGGVFDLQVCTPCTALVAREAFSLLH